MPPDHTRHRELRARLKVVARTVLGVRLLNQLVTSRKRGRRVLYDPQATWNVRYQRSVADGGIDDVVTLNRHGNPRLARYHYNTVENAILERALHAPFPDRPALLDVGSGAGHWIDFYRSAFDARRVVGIEVAAPAADALRSRYAAEADVAIEELDISGDIELGERFDIVNAVDVLFHVVDDRRWRRAVENLGHHLAPGGFLVIVEYVARIPYDAGLRSPDAECGEPAADDVVMVTKRARSLRQWKACGREAGLTLVHTRALRQSRTLSTPANRLLVFAGPQP
jgi:SAM-dependent methyltransferase